MIAAGVSAATVFFNPAAGAMLPNLINRDRLVAANTGIWTAAVASQIALAPATGLLSPPPDSMSPSGSTPPAT